MSKYKTGDKVIIVKESPSFVGKLCTLIREHTYHYKASLGGDVWLVQVEGFSNTNFIDIDNCRDLTPLDEVLE